MKLVCVDDLLGNEILALPVVSDTEVVLIQSGTVLKQEYIDKIRNLNLKRIYIEDEGSAKDQVLDAQKQANQESDTKKDQKSDQKSHGKSRLEDAREHVSKNKNGTKENDIESHIYKIEETKKDTEEIVQKVLERHIYKHNQELKVIGEAADKILTTVLSEPEVISNITEIRNVSTDMYTHCINVCTLSTIMALRLRMSEKQVHNVAVGAILHDIGLKYIQVPYNNRNEKDMNEKELVEYKKHTIYGYSSLQDEKWISDTSKEIILLHHERIDGSGFPFNQKGDKLRSEVKLVSLCDEFDSLISGIGNRKMKIYEAIEFIKVHAGDIFDANIATKLLESIAVYPVGMNVITSDGEKAVVIRQNREATDRPVLRMTYHTDGSPYSNLVEKNLMRYLTVFIVDTE